MAIFGNIESLSPLFSKTQELEYLLSQIQALFHADFRSKIQSLKVGENFQTPLKYEMFFVTHCYALREEKEGFFESHYKYIDVQVVLEGFERFLIGEKDRFKLSIPYDESKDLEVHQPTQALNELLLREKEACILFPQDVHGVGIGRNEEIGKIVKKAIFKVPKTLIKHRL